MFQEPEVMEEKRYGLEHKLKKTSRRYSLKESAIAVAIASAICYPAYRMSDSYHQKTPDQASTNVNEVRDAALEKRLYRHAAEIVDDEGTNLLTKVQERCGKQFKFGGTIYGFFYIGDCDQSSGINLENDNPISREQRKLLKMYGDHRNFLVATHYIGDSLVSIVNPDFSGNLEVVEFDIKKRTRRFIRNPVAIDLFKSSFDLGVNALILIYGSEHPLPPEVDV